MKKLIFLALTLVVLALPAKALATDGDQIICPQPYGGGVVCGIKTHTPVETGLAENLGVAGAIALGASGIFLHLSKKAKATI